MMRVWRFFTSLKLYQIAGLLFIAFAAIGSALVSALPKEFEMIDREILFPWLGSDGLKYFYATFWVYGLILIILIIALNTLICSLDKLPAVFRQINRPAVKDRHPFLRWTVLAPYLAHLGFLLVLFGHLISATSGFRSDDNIFVTDKVTPLPHLKAYLKLERFTPKFFDSGMPQQFYSEVTLLDEDFHTIKSETISVNHPMFYQGAGFYQKSYGESLDKITLNIETKDGTKHIISLAEGEKNMISENLIVTFKTFTPNFRGRGFGMAYFTLTTASGFYNGAAYLVRGGNSVKLGSYYLTVTDASSKVYTVLTINRDPGAAIVLIGATLLTLFALITAAVDYRKFLVQS